jgi:WD40 repeat protein
MTMSDTQREQHLDEILAAYLEAVARGWAPDRQRFLDCYPHLADDLSRFFAGNDLVEGVAAPLRPEEDRRPPMPPSVPTLGPDGPSAGPATGWPRVPGYEILEEVARGGMGVVYKARQVQANRIVALKMILTGGHAGKAERERFRREAEAVARLRHPNVVQIHEVGEHDSLPFFSLEFCDGGSLADHLDGTPLAPGPAARLIETLARAIHACHEQRLIHRDLKPANVLLVACGLADERSAGAKPQATDYVPKITDFGLAKNLDLSGGTASNAIVGTPSYMAPEQATSQQRKVSPATDVYALGAILYELLTGRPPFKAATPLDTVLQVMNDEPVPPRQLQSKTPPDLERICLKCLEKDPGKRYASAVALAEDLGRFQRGEPVQGRVLGRLARTGRWCRRNPAVAALLASVALTLVVGAAVASALAVIARANELAALYQQGRADEQKQLADERAADAQANEARANAEKRRAEEQRDRADGLAYAGQISLAQREWQDGQVGHAVDVLDGCQWNLRGWEHRYLYTLFHSKQRTLRGHYDRVSTVCFSPDGKRLASGSSDMAIKLWDAKGGQELFTLNGHTQKVQCVCFSPDGKRLASAAGGQGQDAQGKPLPGELKVWDVERQQEVLSLQGHTEGIARVCFSPDGKRLASASWDKTVRIWDAERGTEVLTLKGHTSGVEGVCFGPDGKRLASGGDDKTVKVWDVDRGQEVLTLKGHTGNVDSVCFSPDGKRLAIASDDKTVKVWDVDRGQDVLTLKGHTGIVESVCFSPDGKRLASGSDDRTVKLWDAERGQEMFSLKGHTDGVDSVCFSPDGKRLASGSDDRTVKLWDAEEGQEIPTLTGHTSWVHDVCFSPDGKRLASAGQGWDDEHEKVLPGELKVWDVERGQVLVSLKGHTGSVLGVCFSPDGTRLASAGAGQDPEGKVLPGEIKVWDVEQGREILALKGHTGEVNCVCFSPDGTRLASASADQTVKVWDAEGGQEILTLNGHTGYVVSVCFSPDGKRLASSSNDQTVRVWDAEHGQELLILKGHTGSVLGVCFSPDGTRLASASLDRTVTIWEAERGQEVLSLKGHSSAVRSVCFSPDGTRLASGADDQTVKVWDAERGQEVLTLKAHTGEVNRVRFSPDGTRLASASGDQTVKLWDAQKRQEVLALKGHTDGVTSVCISPDGKRLASGGDDQTVRIWDVERGQEVLTLTGHTQGVNCVCFGPDGKRLASAGHGQDAQGKPLPGEVKVWDVEQQQEVLSLQGLATEVASVCFSPDGKRLATASWDMTVRLWDAERGTEMLTLKGHTGSVEAVCFSPDGKRLASASDDKTVKVWDVDSGQELLSLDGHTAGVRSVCFSPDGKCLASASWDQTVNLWDAERGQKIRTLAGHSSVVTGVCFSPDGKRLASASMDETVLVWDAEHTQKALPLKGHTDRVFGVCFSPDGKRLASASYDQTVKVWDLAAEERLRAAGDQR